MAKRKQTESKVKNETPITPVRLLPADKAAVERIKTRFNLSTTADAIRMAIHFVDTVPVIDAERLARKALERFRGKSEKVS